MTDGPGDVGRFAAGPVEPVIDRRGRDLLARTEVFFAGRSRAMVVGAGLGLVVAVALLDIVVGRDYSLSLFYLLPVAFLTWNGGKVMGVLLAVTAGVAWFIAELASGLSPQSLVPYWNFAVRSSVFLLVVGLLATLRDSIQRERKLVDQEREAAEGLRELNALKDTLLHALSHDLRGPIAAILGSSHTLSRSAEIHLSADDEASLVVGILRSARKLDRLVTDLLDLDRLDRGMVEPERTPTDVGHLAEAVAAECDELGGRPVRVIASPIIVAVDGGKVERILENLLLNAARHTPAGTPVLVSVHASDGGVLLSVEDEGPGVPDDLKQVVFDAFRRGTGSLGGAGIGLSLVARFAELHGGRAWVEDRPGGGSAFRVLVPGGAPRPAASTGRSSSAAAG